MKYAKLKEGIERYFGIIRDCWEEEWEKYFRVKLYRTEKVFEPSNQC